MPPSAKVRPIENHALDNLRFIRETMERSSSFTAVPGWAGVAMGATALLAAWFAARQPDRELWLATWLGEGMLAIAIGAGGVIAKASRIGQSLTAAPARKFALSFAPPVVVGALLTVALWRAGMAQLLPGLWLMLYGTAVITGGAYSVRAIPAMGAVFVALGAAALFLPAGDLFLALGFGATHIFFGFLVARRHGG